MRRLVWLLPQPVRTAPTLITGLVLLIWVSRVAQHGEVGAGGVDDGGQAHDLLVGDVAVGHDAHVGLGSLRSARQLVLVLDGNAVGVEIAGQLGGVLAAVDVGDLGGGEGHDLDESSSR